MISGLISYLVAIFFTGYPWAFLGQLFDGPYRFFQTLGL